MILLRYGFLFHLKRIIVFCTYIIGLRLFGRTKIRQFVKIGFLPISTPKHLMFPSFHINEGNDVNPALLADFRIESRQIDL